jgi:hypothetical protein
MTRAESNRINGAKSHGPKTPEGLAISSMNAVRHGITAKTLILRNEDPAVFLEILSAYRDELQPLTQSQIDLVSDIVAARWRLLRVWRYETAILDLEMDSQAPDFEKRFEEYDEDLRGSAAFAAQADKSKGLSRALRYNIHLTQTYRRSLELLYRMKRESAARANAAPNPATGAPQPGPETRPLQIEPIEIETRPLQIEPKPDV